MVKTKILVFPPKHSSLCMISMFVNTALCPAEQVQSGGFTFDSSFAFTSHFQSVIKSCRTFLYNLPRIYDPSSQLLLRNPYLML